MRLSPLGEIKHMEAMITVLWGLSIQVEGRVDMIFRTRAKYQSQHHDTQEGTFRKWSANPMLGITEGDRLNEES